MPELIFCDFCGVELQASRAFIHHMEIADYAGNEAVIAYLEQSRDYHVGEPLRLCKECFESAEQNRGELSAEEAAIEWDRRRFWIIVRFGCGSILLFIELLIVITLVLGLLRHLGFR